MNTGCTRDQTIEEPPCVLRRRTHGKAGFEWQWIAELGTTPERDRWTNDLWKALHFNTLDEARNVAKTAVLSSEIQIARCQRCEDIIAGRY